MDAAARAAAEPGVVYAEPLARRYARYRPNDPLYEFQWNLQQLDLERAWDINTGASNAVVVAVIDSGVAYADQGAFAQAPDLAGTRFVPGYDFIWDDDTPVDLDGHGTHVTGTIAQTTNNATGTAGFAFNVSIMPIKAISGEWDEILGSPNVGTSVTVAQAIRFAADHGAKVINLSIGGFDTSTAERDAVVYAVDKGAVVVAAAGNDGEEGSRPIVSGPVRQGHRRRDRRRRGGLRPSSGAVLQRERLRRDRGSRRRRGGRPQRRRLRRRRAAADARLRAPSRRAGSTSSATSFSTGRRWPRRMSPGWPPC